MKILKGTRGPTHALTAKGYNFYSNTPLLDDSGMSQSPRSTDTDGTVRFTAIPVSPELRDKIRVEKAREGLDYDTWLRENLPIEA